ncbi:MAG: hypothetical protein H5U08_07175, partial [Thermogutta sp.]|uniref:hypothetical protein n=1 Tax=Thermogutta sp. TaxID=1962930 RepID=UPI0019BF2961
IAPQRKDCDPQWLRFEELEITPAGQRMLAENRIEARSQVHEESFLFDPIGARILTEEDSLRYSSQSPAIRVNPEVFHNLFPENLIREWIPNARFPWWRPQARIQGLRPIGKPKILWREVMATVDLLDGQLTLQLPNETETEYINRLPPGEIVERFLTPALGLDSLAGEKLETWPIVSAFSGGSDGGQYVILPRLSETIPDSARWCIVNPKLLSLAVSVQAQGRLIVGFDPNLSHDLAVQWNSDGAGCQVIERGNWPFPDSVLCVCETHTLIGHRLQVRVQDEEVLLPVGVWTPNTTSAPGEPDVLRNLAAKLRHVLDEERLLIPRWWQKKETFETQTREILVQAGYSMSEAEVFIARLETRFTNIQKRRGAR